MEAPEEAVESLQVYAKRHGVSIVDSMPLGFGQDGMVWLSERDSAVKWLERDRAYQSERDAYLRLQEEGITHLGRFDVPILKGYDDDLRIVEISIVTPPYLLDFGKA